MKDVEMKNRKTITAIITPDLYEKLNNYKVKKENELMRHVSITSIVSDAVREYMERKEAKSE